MDKSIVINTQSTELSTNSVDNSNIITNETEVCKSNRLIESSYRLTTAENRLLYIAMSKLKVYILNKNTNIAEVEQAIKSANFDLIHIDVIEYKRKFHIKSNNLYNQLSTIAKSLFNEQIIYFSSNNKITQIRWVITCQYDEDNKSVSIQFHPDLIKDLLVLKDKFTRMLFDNFLNIKKKYSFRIYELCKQYLIIGSRIFDVEDLRFKLCLKDTEYRSYGVFKRQVLKTSIKEINECTDIHIDLQEVEVDKKTKKVIKIKFIIKKNKIADSTIQEKQLSFVNSNSSPEDIEIVNKLSNVIGFNLSAGEAESILMTSLNSIDKYQINIGVIDYIKNKVDICNQYSLHNIVKNPVGLIITALKYNWGKKQKNMLINGINIKKLEEELRY